MLCLLAVQCKQAQPQPSQAEPAIRVEINATEANYVRFTVNTIDVETVEYGVAGEQQEAISIARREKTSSTGPDKLELEWNGLEQNSSYLLCVRGIGPSSETGRWTIIPFSTASYGLPSFADMTLVTMGWHNYSPPVWTPERFASHVSYVGDDGKERWLFDSFLCIDGWDPVRNLSFSITPDRKSATQDSWLYLLDAWLGPDGALVKLEKAIADAESRIGPPPSHRYVIMAVPDPIMFQTFGDKSSSTRYWGTIDGHQTDFSQVEDQIAAYKWYIDQCRSRFSRLSVPHLKLAGFYILSEELHLGEDYYKQYGLSYSSSDIWNSQYKRWETIIPAASAYIHDADQGLWWIPYYLAPGHRLWDRLGIDMTFMQPNHYWDTDANEHPLSKSIAAMKQYGMGIELEFEYTILGNDSYKKKLREYLSAYKEAGLYGKYPIAVYSGTDAMHQIATSSDAEDQKMYREICTFITESPLKR